MAAPMGEPVAESAAEAIQTSVMAVRLVLAIANAARRTAQRDATGRAKDLPLPEPSRQQAAGELKATLPPDITAALMADANWTQMAQQLMALSEAKVDLADLLPRVGEIAVNVRDDIKAKAERAAREGTEEQDKVLRDELPAGKVRTAIRDPEDWPTIAELIRDLIKRDADIKRVLLAGHAEGERIFQKVHSTVDPAADAAAVAPSKDAEQVYGVATGLDIPADLNLSDGVKARQQLSIGGFEEAKCIRRVNEALVEHPREAALLTSSRLWPVLVARMLKMDKEKIPVEPRLARLAADVSWKEGKPSDISTRLFDAANDVLQRPVLEEVDTGRRGVSTTAAKAQSPSVAGPTKASAKSPAPKERAAAAHRASTTPKRSSGRSK
ncbi:hypothetical protein [Streptomyces noursei]|uniref:hypothetical protein n=1 Tax=Streptomyces noursei TaxID=1971 RepID=UPI0023B82B40|nr:hypothetical protein [Streptomyces noursei]